MYKLYFQDNVINKIFTIYDQSLHVDIDVEPKDFLKFVPIFQLKLKVSINQELRHLQYENL